MRVSGILLHPTSLPGDHGIGDLGDWAFRFADYLAAGGQRLWQVLPLGPPAQVNSPYDSCSSMAGNPLLISLALLQRQGRLAPEDLAHVPRFSSAVVDFDAVAAFKWKLLRRASDEFFARSSPSDLQEFEQFCLENAYWLDKHAAFSALRDENSASLWSEWRHKSDPALEGVRLHKYVQFEFQAGRKYAQDNHFGMRGGDNGVFDSSESGLHPEGLEG